MTSMRYFLKFLSSFRCSSESFLKSRLSSTRLPINWFLIKRTWSSKSFLNSRLSGTRLLIKWFLIKKRACKLIYELPIRKLDSFI